MISVVIEDATVVTEGGDNVLEKVRVEVRRETEVDSTPTKEVITFDCNPEEADISLSVSYEDMKKIMALLEQEREMSMVPEDKKCDRHPLTKMMLSPLGPQCPVCLEEAYRNLPPGIVEKVKRMQEEAREVADAGDVVKRGIEHEQRYEEERRRNHRRVEGAEVHPHKVTRRAILELAQHDAFVNAYLRLWHDGEATWDETMQCIVSELSHRLRDAESRAVEEQINHPPTLLLRKTPMTKEEFQRRYGTAIREMLEGLDQGLRPITECHEKLDVLYEDLVGVKLEDVPEAPDTNEVVARRRVHSRKKSPPPWRRDVEGLRYAIGRMDKAALMEYLGIPPDLEHKDPTLPYLRIQAGKKLEYEVRNLLLVEGWADSMDVAEEPQMWWHKIRRFAGTIMHADIGSVRALIMSNGANPTGLDAKSDRELRETALRILDRSAEYIEKVAKWHWDVAQGKDVMPPVVTKSAEEMDRGVYSTEPGKVFVKVHSNFGPVSQEQAQRLQEKLIFSLGTKMRETVTSLGDKIEFESTWSMTGNRNGNSET